MYTVHVCYMLTLHYILLHNHPGDTLALVTKTCLFSSINESNCEDHDILLGGENVTACMLGHDGSQGIQYQILAGPVFNNIYPLVGVLVGILADRFNRKILLGLSLLFWSLATGATGFAQNYWMIVVFRLLLAIG